MVGVAAPLKQRARNLITGLFIGAAVSSALLGLAIAGLGSLSVDVLAATPAIIALVGVLVVLATMDLFGRTPSPRRQVPQRFVRELNGLSLGLTWGADLGLVFSTVKVTSIAYAMIAVALLVDPASALYSLPAFSMSMMLGVAILSGDANTAAAARIQNMWLKSTRAPALIGAAVNACAAIVCLVRMGAQ